MRFLLTPVCEGVFGEVLQEKIRWLKCVEETLMDTRTPGPAQVQMDLYCKTLQSEKKKHTILLIISVQTCSWVAMKITY